MVHTVKKWVSAPKVGHGVNTGSQCEKWGRAIVDTMKNG